jgi:hypothetical protein
VLCTGTWLQCVGEGVGGFTSAGVQYGALTKAVLGAMGGKAAAATTQDLAQTVWALAKMGR